jgi:hypothetical protein
MDSPFVSRARYADREREILELRRELADLRHKYDRVIDRINFRSTGFHLDDRFAAEDVREPEEIKKAAGVASEQPKEEAQLTGIAAAISEVGRRPTAIRNFIENTAATDYQAKEKAFDEQQRTRLREEAYNRMTEALKAKSVPEAPQQA